MPGSAGPAPVQGGSGAQAASAPGNGSNGSAAPAASGSDEDVGWIWPAQGPLVAGFDEAKNKGLDISGKSGDPVLASADGRVVYSGAGLRGYGNLIILKHNNTFLTAYAHNKTPAGQGRPDRQEGPEDCRNGQQRLREGQAAF